MTRERGIVPDAEAAPRRGRPSLVSREAIIDSALQEGLGVFTMLAVAKRLSITHGALYRYFSSRDDLAAAAVDAVVAAERWDCSPTDWRTLLIRFAEKLWSLCHRVPGFAECTLQMARTPAELDRVMAAHATAIAGFGIDEGDARASVELISEELLLTNVLRCRLKLPPLEGAASPEHISDIGQLDRKLQLILDGVEYRRAP